MANTDLDLVTVFPLLQSLQVLSMGLSLHLYGEKTSHYKCQVLLLFAKYMKYAYKPKHVSAL